MRIFCKSNTCYSDTVLTNSTLNYSCGSEVLTYVKCKYKQINVTRVHDCDAIAHYVPFKTLYSSSMTRQSNTYAVCSVYWAHRMFWRKDSLAFACSKRKVIKIKIINKIIKVKHIELAINAKEVNDNHGAFTTSSDRWWLWMWVPSYYKRIYLVLLTLYKIYIFI